MATPAGAVVRPWIPCSVSHTVAETVSEARRYTPFLGTAVTSYVHRFRFLLVPHPAVTRSQRHIVCRQKSNSMNEKFDRLMDCLNLAFEDLLSMKNVAKKVPRRKLSANAERLSVKYDSELLQSALPSMLFKRVTTSVVLAALFTASQPFSCMASEGSTQHSTSIASQAPSNVFDLPPIPTEFPSLRDLTLPPYEKVVLPNGLRVLLLEDHELGLVGGQLLVRGGGKAEPADKVGLAAITGAVQRAGGSVQHPGDALNIQLEAMAARIEAGAGVSEMSVAFRCLKEDFTDVFTLFTDVVRRPLMPQDKVALVKSQLLGVLSRRNDDPGGVAQRELPKLLYGASSPYARVPEAAGVKSITQEDLQAFHAANFRPDQAVLGIWGDFEPATAKLLVEEFFGDWSPAPSSLTVGGMLASDGMQAAAVEKGLSEQPAAIYLLDRPGLTQGYVRISELGTTLADPDVFVLDVLNSMLNGFGGRLFDQVRSRQGLAYSVYGGWAPAVEHRGSFVAGGETRVDSVPQFVRAVQRVLADLTVEPPSEEELAQAKDAALNSFVFNFVDSGSQLSRIMTYELFGVDQDFLFKYKRAVEQTTREDVLRAAQRHLHPGKQLVLVVTDAKTVRKELESSLDLPIVDLSLDDS